MAQAASRGLDVFDEIDILRKERNAVILAHYYQESEIQDLADHIGDSLQLAKAASDIICTSSNAEKVVRSFPADQPLIFAPDRNLGRWLIKKTGRDMLLWQGVCIVHETFSEKRLVELKVRYPNAKVICHPECEE